MDKKYKRTRPIACTFCVSEEENERLLEKIKLSGLTKQDYFLRRALDDNAIVCRKTASDKPAVVIEGGPEIAHNLQKIGTNLNQVATSLNILRKYVNERYIDDDVNDALQALSPCIVDCRNAFDKILGMGRPT
ncbi:MAG: hypothetical protein LUD47_00235 [Clostridia bacterium]|nr:hypothetical protein [Clostridia bacterium]